MMWRKLHKAMRGLWHVNRPVVPHPAHKEKDMDDSVLAPKETHPSGVPDKIPANVTTFI